MILFRPGPNNTVIIVIVVNGTNVPNISLPNILNITVQPTPSMKKDWKAEAREMRVSFRYQRLCFPIYIQ